jgi:hypothetical protein
VPSDSRVARAPEKAPPESGMGYQRVDVRLANNRQINDVIVLNAEEIELPSDCDPCEIAEIRIHGS